MRSVFLSTEPWGPAHRSFISSSRSPLTRISFTHNGKARFRISRVRDFQLCRTIHHRTVSCLENDSASVSRDEQEQPPQEAILKAIAG